LSCLGQRCHHDIRSILRRGSVEVSHT
jgi:hypothetical protein